MKKLLLALFALPAMVFAQGNEDFSNATGLPTGTDYGNGQFVGNNGVTWHYVHCQDQGAYSIDGNGILLRRSNEPSALYANIQSGGIGNFSVKTRKGYSGNTQRRIKLLINDVEKGNLLPTFPSGESSEVVIFSVPNINIEGSFTLKLELYGATGNQHIVLDDIIWTGYETAVPAACTITATALTGVTCDNNGTPTVENDDNIKFTLTPTAVLGATTYNVTVPAGYTVTPASADYGVATEFTLSGAGNGAVVVTITDADDQDCTVDVTVEDPGICSSATPVLTTSVNTLALANYTLPFAATQGQFTFTGLTLAGDVTVAVTGNFEISKDNVTFANTLIYALGSETAMPDSVVYVRSTATAAGVNAGTITVSSTNATDVTVALTTTVSEYAAMPIPTMKLVDENGVAVNKNTLVTATGVTQCTNYHGTRYSFFMVDEDQNGIYIFRNSMFNYYTFAAGDRIQVYGKIDQYNGLTQIVADSITVIESDVIVELDATVVSGPIVEAHESQYIVLEDVSFATPTATWPNNSNVTVVKDGVEYTVRVLAETGLSGEPTPTTPTFTIYGFGMQFDSSNPFTSGYQLYPCGPESIVEGEVIECANPATGEVTYDAATGIITATDVDPSYSYQWISCGENAPEFPEIMFQTAQTYQVTVSGSYAVRVSNSNPGCTMVESECLEIVVDDSKVENVLAATTVVYPNPFNTSLTIVSDKAVSYNVVDVQGKTIATTQLINGKVSVNTESWLQGVYFIQLVGANAETHTVKVIK